MSSGLMVEKDFSEELRQAEQQIKFLQTINKSLQLKTNEFLSKTGGLLHLGHLKINIVPNS